MIETARLTLRGCAEADRNGFRALLADVSVGDGRTIPREDADALFEFHRACWAEHGFAYAAIVRRADAAFLGMAGITRASGEAPVHEIGWGLLPAFRGQGYAAEAAAGWLDHGFGELRLPRVIATTSAGNPASLRLLTRLGFRPLAFAGLREGDLAFALTPALWGGNRAAVIGPD